MSWLGGELTSLNSCLNTEVWLVASACMWQWHDCLCNKNCACEYANQIRKC